MPIHDLVEKISADIIEISSAAHALTGCDTASKLDTKVADMLFLRQRMHVVMNIFVSLVNMNYGYSQGKITLK